MPRVAGVVLAAGAGSRMGGPKAELRLQGVRLLDRAVASLRGGRCEPVFAVVRDATPVAGATVVVNPDPGRGMRSSLALAVRACEGTDAMAVILVDTPGVGAAAVGEVVQAWRPGRIALGGFTDGRRGHPIVMAVAQWADAVGHAGADEGARSYLREHADLVDVVAVPGTADDLDTPEDLARWSG